jgi:hypothetical protein
MGMSYKCPLCDGKGKNPFAPEGALTDECIACDGKGIVWGPADSYITRIPPWEPYGSPWYEGPWYGPVTTTVAPNTWCDNEPVFGRN